MACNKYRNLCIPYPIYLREEVLLQQEHTDLNMGDTCRVDEDRKEVQSR